MPDGQLILVAGALLAAALAASLLAGRIRVPGLVLFLGLGMAIGSDGVGWIEFDDYEKARTIGVVALALILFEGGLTAASARSAGVRNRNQAGDGRHDRHAVIKPVRRVAVRHIGRSRESSRLDLRLDRGRIFARSGADLRASWRAARGRAGSRPDRRDEVVASSTGSEADYGLLE